MLFTLNSCVEFYSLLVLTETIQVLVGVEAERFHSKVGRGDNVPLPTPLFKHAAALMLECLERGCIDVSRLPKVSAKKLYKEFVETPSTPKVCSKYPGVEWDRVWRRIQSCILESSAQDLMFSLIHNILSTRVRLLRLNHLVNNSFCESCPGQVQDITHVFTQCGRVREAWEWTRSVLVSLDPVNLVQQSDVNIIHVFTQQVQEKMTIYVFCLWYSGEHSCLPSS